MRLTIRKLVVLAIGIVIALLIAACGGATKGFTVAKTHREMTEAGALNALSAYGRKLAGEGELAGAVLIAKDDRVLFRHAYGLADRARGIPNMSARGFASGR
jgi:CubicO group peptidase (beta-lactamase class C family)